MTANESWITQGRQEHGRFGNGTAGTISAGTGERAKGAARKPTWARRYGWAAPRQAAQRSGPAMPDTVLGPLIVPFPSMGPVAAARARRRFAFALEEARNGYYESALGHLLFGKPFPAEVDDPPPEKLPPATGNVSTAPELPDPENDPNGKLRGKLIGSLAELTESERRWADDRLSEGKNVEVVPTSNIACTPDFKIDGLPVELKTLENPQDMSANGLSARISRLILNARSQAE
jgi:hypothetical protein